MPASVKVKFNRIRDLWSVSDGDIDALSAALGIKPSYAYQKVLGHKSWFADELNALADEINRAGLASCTPDDCIKIIGAKNVRVRGTLADEEGS
jgi:hypothetical protein